MSDETDKTDKTDKKSPWTHIHWSAASGEPMPEVVRQIGAIALAALDGTLDDNKSKALVAGEVVLDTNAKPFTNARLQVRLLDTSLADAPAKLIAEYVKEGVSSGDLLSFEIHGEKPDPRVRCTVQASIDVDGDGKTSPGDYVSTQSYPVINHGHTSVVKIVVTRVG